MRTDKRHARTLENVAARYRREGYDVIVEPTQRDLPEWLTDFRPDLLARNDDEHVVVEVKEANSVRGQNWLALLADSVNQHEGWRFEFVTIPASRRVRTTDELRTIAGPRRVREYADAASDLEARGYNEQAFLLAWVAFEGALRTAFQRDGVKVGSANPTSLIKTLWSMGYLYEPADLERLEQLWELRNRLAHGYAIDYQSETDVRYLLELSTQLIAESE
jgi:hypothetical protein